MSSFDFALKVFLFLAPIIYWGNRPLASVQLQFFQLGTIFLFFVALSQRKQRDLRDISLFGLALVCFLNTFIAQTPYSKMALTNILFSLLFYYLVVCYTKNVRCLFRTLVWLSAINALLALSQKLGFDFVFDTSFGGCGFMGTSAYHGDLQAMVLPIAIFLHPLLAIFPLTGMFFARSDTAILAVIAGLVFFLVRRKVSMMYFLALFSGIAIFALQFSRHFFYKFTLRMTLWKKALEIIFDKPLMGWGFGSIRGLTGQFDFPQYGTADRLYNDYLEFGLCAGIVGLIALGIFICNKIKRYKRVYKNPLLDTVFASCLIAGVICLSHSPMAPLFSGIGESPRVAIIVIAIFAMLEIVLQQALQKKEEVLNVS